MTQLLNILVKACILYIFICTNSYATTQNSALSFFSQPDMVMAKISPNGEFVVTINHHEKAQKLTLIDTKTNTPSLLLDLEGIYKESASISKLVWVDDEHIAVQLVVTKKGVDGLLDTKSSRRLIIIKRPIEQQQVQVFSVKTKGWLVHSLPSEPGVFLYAKSSLYSKVYKISVNKLAIEGKKLSKLSKVDGGQFKSSNEVKRISGYATRWFFDVNGEPQAVLHVNNERQLTLSSYTDKEEVVVLKSWDTNSETEQTDDIESELLEKKLVPLEFAGTADSFYCLDLNEEEKRTVYLVNYKTGVEEIIFEADSYEIVDIEISPETKKITSVKVINNGMVESVFINVESDLQQGVSSEFVTQISASNGSGKTLLYRESHNNSGQFYLRSETNEKLIGAKYPHLSGKINSRLIESSINVQGIEIPYLLSLPTTLVKSHPLVVMPHGGPIGVYDTRYYNPIVQYLVYQGYAVLQVNYRGSSGYTSELKAAGKNQWSNLMLEDIYRATLAVAKRPDIELNNICSFGMSYGGYAALMLTIKHPETYKCAANWAGVTDLNLYAHNPRLNHAQIKWIEKHVGVINWGYDKLKANSPVFLVEDLQTPVFIAHGRKDEIVDIENAYRMKLMLAKYNKNYEWYEDTEAAHNFGSVEQSKAYFSRLTKFLRSYLY